MCLWIDYDVVILDTVHTQNERQLSQNSQKEKPKLGSLYNLEKNVLHEMPDKN